MYYSSSFVISAPAGLTARRVVNSHPNNTITETKGCVDISASITSLMESDGIENSIQLAHYQTIVDCLSNVKKESTHTTISTTKFNHGGVECNEEMLIESFIVSAPPALVPIRGDNNATYPSSIEEDLRAYTDAITPKSNAYSSPSGEDDEDRMMMMTTTMPPAPLLSLLDPTSLSSSTATYLEKWIAHRDLTRKVVALSELMEDQYLITATTRGGGGGDCRQERQEQGIEGDAHKETHTPPSTTASSNRPGGRGMGSSMSYVSCCGSKVFTRLEGSGQSPSLEGGVPSLPTVEDCGLLAPILLVPSSFLGVDECGYFPTPTSTGGCRLQSNVSSTVNTPRPPSAALLRHPIPSWARTAEEGNEVGGEEGGVGVSPRMSDFNASTCSVPSLACTTGSVSTITTSHTHHDSHQHQQRRTSTMTNMTSFIRRRSSLNIMLLPPAALVPRLAATQIENDCEISLGNLGCFVDTEEDVANEFSGVEAGGGGGCGRWSPNWSFLNGRSPQNSATTISVSPQHSAFLSSRRLSYNPTLVNVCVPASGGLASTSATLQDACFNSRRPIRGRAQSGSSRNSVDHPLFANHHTPVASDGSAFNTPSLLPAATGGISGSATGGFQQPQGPSPTYPPHQSSTNNIQQPCSAALDNSLTSNDVHGDMNSSILSSSGGRRFSYDGNTNNMFPFPSAFQLHQKGGPYCRRDRGDCVRSTNAWTTSGGTTPSVTAVNPYEDATPSDGGLNQTTPVTVNLLHWL